MNTEKMKTKTMTDAAGNEVPAIYVSAYDKKREKLVKKIFARWEKERKALEAVMVETLADLDSLQASRLAETGAEMADRGNFRVSSFDGMVAVEMRQSYRIFLDDRVKEAQRILIAWASEIAEQIANRAPRALMMQLIAEAFSVNASGSLPVGKILSLLRRDIQDPEWQRAKKLLQAAIQPEKGKCYISVMARCDRQHDMKRVALDVSDCWPIHADEEH